MIESCFGKIMFFACDAPDRGCSGIALDGPGSVHRSA